MRTRLWRREDSSLSVPEKAEKNALEFTFGDKSGYGETKIDEEGDVCERAWREWEWELERDSVKTMYIWKALNLTMRLFSFHSGNILRTPLWFEFKCLRILCVIPCDRHTTRAFYGMHFLQEDSVLLLAFTSGCKSIFMTVLKWKKVFLSW